MTAFAFNETVPAPTMLTSALGTGGANIWTDAEKGKAVKLSTSQDSTHVLATNGDEIDGFVGALAIGTVNNGYSHGSVQIEGWMVAKIGTHQPTAGNPAVVVAAKPGDWVVADDQPAFGTAGLPNVKTSSTAKSGWKVMRVLTGTGVVGDQVLLFKC